MSAIRCSILYVVRLASAARSCTCLLNVSIAHGLLCAASHARREAASTLLLTPRAPGAAAVAVEAAGATRLLEASGAGRRA